MKACTVIAALVACVAAIPIEPTPVAPHILPYPYPVEPTPVAPHILPYPFPISSPTPLPEHPTEAKVCTKMCMSEQQGLKCGGMVATKMGDCWTCCKSA